MSETSNKTIEKHFNQFVRSLGEVDKVVVGYSGGVDSQALLALAVKHFSVPVVALHINHGLSDNSDFWVDFCREQAQQMGAEFVTDTVDLSSSDSNIEERAREARYEVFQSHLTERSVLLTGHHMNDQAETFLLRLMRGSGVDGLSAIQKVRPLGKGRLMRPLLDVSKDELTNYVLNSGLAWVEDESNKDTKYDRNFIRNEVLPLLEKRWGNASASIAKSARNCSEASTELQRVVKEDFDSCNSSQLNTLSVSQLKKMSRERQGVVLRYWLKKNGQKMPERKTLDSLITYVIDTKEHAAKFETANYTIHLYRNDLYFQSAHVSVMFELLVHKFDKRPGAASLLTVEPSLLVRRDRQEGDKMRYRGHTKSLTKIFQEEGIPSWNRKDYPVFTKDEEIVAVGDIISSDHIGSSGYQIVKSQEVRQEDGKLQNTG